MGVTKEILKAGNGIKPTPGQSVTVHCTGYGKNRDLSKKFWCELCLLLGCCFGNGDTFFPPKAVLVQDYVLLLGSKEANEIFASPPMD